MSSSRLTLFICEFITGGGLCNVTLANSLAKEGALMRDALLKEVVALDQFNVITTHDHRVGASNLVGSSIEVAHDFDAIFKSTMLQAELVWLIAPESDGVLSEYSQQCFDAGVMLIGSDSQVFQVTSNKLACTELLAQENILVIPAISAQDWLGNKDFTFPKTNSLVEKWVAKPIDGVGCEGVQLFNRQDKMNAWLIKNACAEHYLIQPYHHGISASFSMLCKAGQAFLLSCNTQHVSVLDDTFILDGITVNGMAQYWPQMEALGQQIAKALPGAAGYIGVDVMIDPTHDKISVIEINPRLTTSYVAMGEATGHNVAALILTHSLTPTFNCPVIEKNIVSIRI
jgi:predicted ATP-grasp superfamily ATP-dependent carboligase